MNKTLRSIVASGRWQLNAIGLGLLILLACSAWQLTHPLTAAGLIPLAAIAYAVWRILFELTWNRHQIPTLATSLTGRRKIIEFMRAHAANYQRRFSIIDLGSGRGELAWQLARALPQADVLGIEQARWPHWQSIWLQRLFGPKNLIFKSLDFWLYDCSRADAIYLFLNQFLAEKVGVKLAQEMPVGGLVVSHSFPLRGAWEPDDIIEFRTPFKETIYVYRKR